MNDVLPHILKKNVSSELFDKNALSDVIFARNTPYLELAMKKFSVKNIWPDILYGRTPYLISLYDKYLRLAMKTRLL